MGGTAGGRVGSRAAAASPGCWHAGPPGPCERRASACRGRLPSCPACPALLPLHSSPPLPPKRTPTLLPSPPCPCRGVRQPEPGPGGAGGGGGVPPACRHDQVRAARRGWMHAHGAVACSAAHSMGTQQDGMHGVAPPCAVSLASAPPYRMATLPGLLAPQAHPAHGRPAAAARALLLKAGQPGKRSAATADTARQLAQQHCLSIVACSCKLLRTAPYLPHAQACGPGPSSRESCSACVQLQPLQQHCTHLFHLPTLIPLPACLL